MAEGRLRRLRRALSREEHNSSSLFQTFYFGLIATLAGILGIGGAFGDDTSTRFIGTVVFLIGLTLAVMSFRRLRQ